MGDFWGRLFDPTGFVARKACGDWSPGLVWLHVGSDLGIWLAYCSIPIILLFFLRKKEDRPPFPGLLLLFAAFILLCGMTHFLDALMFEHPVYRINGLVRLATAAVSWATVLALVPAVPKILTLIHRTRPKAGDTAVHQALRQQRPSWQRDYSIAILTATVAVLARALLDPILYSDHVFVLALLAVMFVAWQCGFKPAVLTLLLSMTAIVFFFVEPRRTFLIAAFSDQVAVGLFFFCGVVCAVLGEAQRAAQRKSADALAQAVGQRTELEREVKRRTEVQYALLHREVQLLESNDRLEAARRQSADALALLDTFFRNAPVGLAFFDRDMRYVRVNEYLARANGRAVEDHVGKPLTDVLPRYPAAALAAFREVLRTGAPSLNMTLDGVRPGTGPDAVWSLNMYPVTRSDGEVLGVGMVSEDVTERLRAEQRLRASEARFRTFVDHSPGPQFIKDAAGRYALVNRAFERQAGRPAADVLGRTDDDLFPPALAARFRDKDEAVRATGRPVETEDAFAHDGVADTILMVRFPLPDGTVGGIGTNITDRKRDAEAIAERGRLALLRAEVSARLASNESSREVLQHCVELIVRHLSAAFVRVWTLDEAGGTLVLQASAGLYTHRDGAHGRVRVGEFKIGRIARDRRALLTNDVAHDPNVSSPEWAAREGMAAFAGYPLLVEGEALGVLALFSRRPLSEAVFADLAPLADSIAQWVSRQRTQEALQRSATRFRLLTEAIPQMVWNADAAGAITYVNTRWQEYTGVSAEAARGGDWGDVVHPDDRGQAGDAWQRAVRGEADRFTSEFRLRRAADGEYRWFLAAAVPLARPDGSVDQWIGSLTDIDAQKRQRETLERLVRERTAELTEIAAALRVEVEERRRAEGLVQATAKELGRSNEELEKFAYVASPRPAGAAPQDPGVRRPPADAVPGPR